MTALTLTAANIRPLNGALVRNFLAGGSLTVGQAVYPDSSGYAQAADANNTATTARGIGIVVASYDGETSIASGHGCSVCMFGPVGGFSSLTPGAYGYISTTAGSIDDGTPNAGYTYVLGYAEDSDTFFVLPGIYTPQSS